ncbi:MAG: hypothetical protein KUG71_08275 [Porticoccaceae bacterium]|nr:hypothetical protein [Porticoccaceae bacterium]
MVDESTNSRATEQQSKREQLARILDSSLFAHAQRLGRFLKFIVDETLAGRAERLNQYAIAIEVFDRDESFDPAIDAIVRVEAGRLRSKLLAYYSESGRDDPIRIEMPKRSYAVTFRHQDKDQSSAPARGETAAISQATDLKAPTLAPLSEPTIAVLPFINLSSDPEQGYFADGITEDLITDLSQLPEVAVISRQSTFAYKGKAVTVQQVCAELGANVVVEGSVRKSGDSVRITAQLIEGASGQHLWAQRYDRDLVNIFELQDEVNQKIVSALSLNLSVSEHGRFARRGTELVDAYDYVLRGMKEAEADTIEGFARARYCFEQALELDPNYATAYARLAMNAIYRWIAGWSNSRKESLDKGFELAGRAVSLDGKLALAHAALCWAYLWQGRHDQAISEGQIAIKCDPNDVVALERLSLCMIWAGEPEAALPLIEKAKRLNPTRTYHFPQGVAMFMLHQYDLAITLLEADLDNSPNFLPAALYLAASKGLASQDKNAASVVAAIKRIDPTYNLSRHVRTHFKNIEDQDRFMAGLERAGLS